ncbi:MAG: phage tail sheath C-terminal domain-containing protein [Terriglobales bacterium]
MRKTLLIAVFAAMAVSFGHAQTPRAAQRTSHPAKSAASVQQYLDQLKVSLQKQTHFAVFEPNNEKLWANIRQTMENFLVNEWQSGHLQGSKPSEAFWVKCDRSTMTQNDLDNGRLIALVGVAPTKPAEFVIIRIGQWTADHRPARRPHKK